MAGNEVYLTVSFLEANQLGDTHTTSVTVHNGSLLAEHEAQDSDHDQADCLEDYNYLRTKEDCIEFLEMQLSEARCRVSELEQMLQAAQEATEYTANISGAPNPEEDPNAA